MIRSGRAWLVKQNNTVLKALRLLDDKSSMTLNVDVDFEMHEINIDIIVFHLSYVQIWKLVFVWRAWRCEWRQMQQFAKWFIQSNNLRVIYSL